MISRESPNDKAMMSSKALLSLITSAQHIRHTTSTKYESSKSMSRLLRLAYERNFMHNPRCNRGGQLCPDFESHNFMNRPNKHIEIITRKSTHKKPESKKPSS